MTLDYLIIGAGPAGLQLAALLEADGRRDYLVLEAADRPGAFFTRYPRHRQLISINKIWTGSEDPEFNLRADWNSLLSDDPELLFKHYSRRYFPAADDFVRYLADFAARTGARVRYDTRVTRVARDGDGFTVAAGGQTFAARRVVVATGVSQLYVPPIEGVELAERYDTVSVDPEDFTNQRVLIIGKGNSGFETADALVATAAVIHVAGPDSIRLAWQTHYVGHLRAVNNNFLDTYQLKSQNAVLDGTIERIERRDGGGYRIDFRYARTVEKLRQLEYDRVILATGFRFDASIFDASARPRLVINDRFPEQTAAYESVNVPGLYFAGTLTQQRDFRKATSGFIHGFRYGVRALHRILGARHHDTPWPAAPVEATPDAIADAIIARINRTSALWQQFAVLGDVVTVDGDTASYLTEVPVAYLRDGGLGTVPLALVTTLEYGPDHDTVDPFDIRVPRIAENDASAAHDASYLHPIVRVYRGGEVVAEHHLAENLENHWDLPAVHQQPLALFLKGVLADAG
ncbi:NAD(P)-binding domain-containing protein [Rhizomonospora bruguierae]|uniref:NAD(P)-binding domain-containing protein n=1 Tax=Rhizomonospora bruguierae TaxID=1581705 RepID=UPI001BCE3AD6|nr:NAD(P)-binding domain-containing protein [Micromonospora sp. NBRC 107566]